MSGIPGSDILSDAFEAIDTVEVQILRNSGRVKNGVGQYVQSFEEPVNYDASVQAVNRSSYTFLGLDFAKTYFNVYLSTDAHAFKRGEGGDQVVFGNKRLEVVSDLDWFDLDGWVGLLCVKLVQPK